MKMAVELGTRLAAEESLLASMLVRAIQAKAEVRGRVLDGTGKLCGNDGGQQMDAGDQFPTSA